MPEENPPPEGQPSRSLAEALSRHAISLPPSQVGLLNRYCQLLWEWNEKINLTRHTTFDRFVARDVIDSLAISRQLDAEEDILDFGTGGGVPGIVLAIVRPDISVSLCDSVGKKARVVAEIVDTLGLDLDVHSAPGQDLLEEGLHDTIVTRAVAALPKLLNWVAPHWTSFRRMLVVKGPAWVEERREARRLGLFQDLQLRKLDEYRQPGADHPSVVLEIKPREESAS